MLKVDYNLILSLRLADCEILFCALRPTLTTYTLGETVDHWLR